MTKIDAERTDKIAKRTGHRADDFNCRYWAGDYAGVNLRAECPICRDPRARANERLQEAAHERRLMAWSIIPLWAALIAWFLGVVLGWWG